MTYCQSYNQEIIDLDSMNFSDVDNWYCTKVIDLTLNNYLFSSLISYIDSDESTDGNDRIKIFTKDDSIVKLISLNQFNNNTYGFELQL